MARQQSADTALLEMTTDIVANFVSGNKVTSDDLPGLMQSVHASLAGLSIGHDIKKSPAVSVKASITPDYIICLEDGKKLKMMKRYLRRVYNLTPEEYRARWSLPADYPMTAPNYSKKRSKLASEFGLGKHRSTKASVKSRKSATKGKPAKKKAKRKAAR